MGDLASGGRSHRFHPILCDRSESLSPRAARGRGRDTLVKEGVPKTCGHTKTTAVAHERRCTEGGEVRPNLWAPFRCYSADT